MNGLNKPQAGQESPTFQELNLVTTCLEEQGKIIEHLEKRLSSCLLPPPPSPDKATCKEAPPRSHLVDRLIILKYAIQNHNYLLNQIIDRLQV